MTSTRRIIYVGMLMSMVLFPVFAIFDWINYPDLLPELLTVRGVFMILAAANLPLLARIDEKYLVPYALVIVFIASVSLTIMCALTGEGFASPHYAGQFVVFLMATVYFPGENRYFLTLIGLCMTQHFAILMNFPFEPGDLAKNVFFLGAFAFCGWINRRYIMQLLSEIKQLRGILPICANCKSIRNDEGFWNKLEGYIAEHTEVRFSHGICPDCAKKLYPDVVD